MFRVYLINFGYYAKHEFSSIFDALEWLKGTSFEGRIDLYRGSYGSKSFPILSYSPLRGLNWWQGLSSQSSINPSFAAQLLGIEKSQLDCPDNERITLGNVRQIWERSKINE